ncbi:spore germination protein [Paenibacillus cremeus]|uniref:Spore germination protein n=1 Tax=Paenibacillus cremeus TaxID=2163881 RepID=A0A559K0L4_9BACL|nr:spore germination protein [Paenibacillus cremeus]TVY05590.1 spore germination protein [Paenibacillus cremeus]
MGNFVQELKSTFAEHDDFFIHEEQFDQTVLFLIGYHSLINFSKSNLYFHQMAELSASVDELFTNLSDQLNVDIKQIIKAVLEGKLVILTGDDQRNAVVEPVPQNLRRSIEEPKNESPIQGPLDAFGEDVDINIGLIRKRLGTERLCHSSYEIGELAMRRISMLYIKGKAPNDLIEKIDKKLKQAQSDIEMIHDLNNLFGARKFPPVNHFSVTELPLQAVYSLKRNRVVLFLDNTPYAFVLPHLFWDMLSTANDRDFHVSFTYFIRILRGLGILANLILPALYIAITSVNPEVLKIDLALFVAESREGIPLAPLFETLAMVVLVDLVIEAINRLPKTVGPTVTMVGGVILGQGVVEAKLVSNLLVIVITAMLISGSTIVGMQNSVYIRALKYFILIAASVFGILGICTGLIFICIILSSLKTCDIPYMSFRITEKEDLSEP